MHWNIVLKSDKNPIFIYELEECEWGTLPTLPPNFFRTTAFWADCKKEAKVLAESFRENILAELANHEPTGPDARNVISWTAAMMVRHNPSITDEDLLRELKRLGLKSASSEHINMGRMEERMHNMLSSLGITKKDPPATGSWASDM